MSELLWRDSGCTQIKKVFGFYLQGLFFAGLAAAILSVGYGSTVVFKFTPWLVVLVGVEHIFGQYHVKRLTLISEVYRLLLRENSAVTLQGKGMYEYEVETFASPSDIEVRLKEELRLRVRIAVMSLLLAAVLAIVPLKLLVQTALTVGIVIMVHQGYCVLRLMTTRRKLAKLSSDLKGCVSRAQDAKGNAANPDSRADD